MEVVNGGGSTAFLEPPIGQQDHPIMLTLNTDLIKNDHPKQLDNDSSAFFAKVLNGEDMGKNVYDALIRGTPAQKKFIDNILKTLAEEVSIHLHEYPEDMLNPICELYGNLLAFGSQLFSKRALSVLWRAVLVALYNHPPESAQHVLSGMIKIVIRAKHTFSHYSNLATCFINAPLFGQFPQDLRDYIMNLRDKPIMELIPYRVPDPPDENICDRVFFVFNNVSVTNVIEKSSELTQLVDEAILPWFAHYLIGKRVSQEVKFHPIFSSVLDNMQEKLPKIRDSVKNELLRNIKQILRSIRSDCDDASSRSTLKALGNFLGLITIAKNKPLLHDEICLKELLYEAYQKGPIPVRYVIPFVSSILGHSCASIVFPPPNPWTMAILKVLREYHTIQSSNENMRFDIELLYQKLGLRLENVQIATYLRDSSVHKTLDVQMIVVVNEIGGAGNQGAGTAVMRPDSLATINSAPSSQMPEHVMNMMLQQQHQQQQDNIERTVAHGAFPTSASTPSGVPQDEFAQYSQQNIDAWTRDQQMMQIMRSRQQQQQQQSQQTPGSGSVVSSRPPPEAQRGTTPPSAPILPSYEEVNIGSVMMAFTFDENMHRGDPRLMGFAGLFESKPELRNSIHTAIDQALKEFCNTIYERCLKITIPTVLAMVRKDFALDPEFPRLRTAGSHMVRHLTASLALVSGRDTLNALLCTRVSQVLLNAIAGSSGGRPGSHFAPTDGERETISFITQTIVLRGINACLAYIQKTVGEAVIHELDKDLEADMKQRLDLGPNRFIENALTLVADHQNNLPAKLRLVPGKPKDLDLVVYEEFKQSIPGFAPGSIPAPPRPNVSTQAVQRYPLQNKFQQIRPPPGTNLAGAGGVLVPQGEVSPTPSTHNTMFFDTITEIFERHVSEIRHHASAQNDPILQSMTSLIQVIQNAKMTYQPQANAPGGLPSREIATNIVSAVVRSIFTHLRPPPSAQPRAQDRGGPDIMQHFIEAVMTTLRQLQSQFPYHWITKQVTHAWISLPESEFLSEESAAVAVSEKETVEDTTTPTTTTGMKSCSIKWNWQALIELLRLHFVSLSEIDTYLAEKVLQGSEATIVFVLDVLDNFILPQQTKLSTHMQIQASLTPTTSTHPLGMVPGANPLGPIGSSIANLGGANANNATAGSNNPSGGNAGNYKRQFTVLNEYDIWHTLEAIRFRVAETESVCTPASLRLKISCAKVRALLDLGLMETALLPVPSASPSQQSSVNQPVAKSVTTVGVAALYAGCSQAREFDDSRHCVDRGDALSFMSRWVECYGASPHRNNQPLETLLNYLQELGLMSSESDLTSFCQTVTQAAIEKALNLLRHTQSKGLHQGQVQVNAYGELDAYAKLMACLIKRCGVKPTAPEYNADQDVQFKIQILNKILGLIAGMLLQENEVRREMFHSMPFERIIIGLFKDLISPSTNPPVLPANPATATTTDPDSKKKTSMPPQQQHDPAKVSNTLQNYIPIAFSHLLHILRPEKATLFVYSWLELLSHRHFISRTLAAANNPQTKTAYQSMYAQLLVDLLKYLAFFLQNALLPKSIQHLYIATLRIFIVLIHDFPEFVCNYYSLFCDVLPTNTVQMRNLILSALPIRNMISAANPLQAPPIDQLSSLDDPTGYCMSAGSRLPGYLKREIDNYLVTREPTPLLADLSQRLRLKNDDQLYSAVNQRRVSGAIGKDYASVASRKFSDIDMPNSDVNSLATTENDEDVLSEDGKQSDESFGVDLLEDVSALWSVRTVRQFATFGQADCMHYNMELITNLVVYLCLSAIRTLRTHSLPLNMETIASQPQMDIFHGLLLSLDNEGRYLLLNCMANQLRYPNSHTYYFSFALLHLFSHQTATEAVKEQISRVLMERLIVMKPHPWGLLMTTSELLRNPSYGFWDHDFARSNQDITSILTQVAERCIPNFQMMKAMRPPSVPMVRQGGSGSGSMMSC